MSTSTAVIRCSRPGDSRIPPPSSWQDLRDRFLELVSIPHDVAPNRWVEIWHVLVGHPWYREQLASVARNILRNSGASLQWQEDIEHDAILLLARRVRKTSDLGIDPARAEQHFAGWMRTIITRDCRDALRKLRRQSSPNIEMPDRIPARDQQNLRESRVDLAVALNQLEEQDRKLLVLHSNGLTVLQVAVELGLTYWEAYGAFHRALQRLRRLL